MVKHLIALATLSLSSFGFAADGVETFFKGLTGKWHGEVPTVYIIDIVASPFDANKPWQLSTGDIEIQEGGQRMLYKFHLSRNINASDYEPVYFMELINVTSGKSSVYTLGHKVKEESPWSFWKHSISKETDGDFITADSLKISLKNGELLWGFADGDGYCKSAEETNLCASGGYTPFFLRRVQ
ncbi:MAG: hypothetical protein AB7T49_04145 [Oligoflexales bacterium]